MVHGWLMDGIVGFDQITNSFNNHGFSWYTMGFNGWLIEWMVTLW